MRRYGAEEWPDRHGGKQTAVNSDVKGTLTDPTCRCGLSLLQRNYSTRCRCCLRNGGSTVRQSRIDR